MDFQEKRIEEIKIFKNYNNNEAMNIVKKFIKLRLMKTRMIYHKKMMITIKVKEFIKSSRILKKRITNSNFSNCLISRIILRKQFR